MTDQCSICRADLEPYSGRGRPRELCPECASLPVKSRVSGRRDSKRSLARKRAMYRNERVFANLTRDW